MRPIRIEINDYEPSQVVRGFRAWTEWGPKKATSREIVEAFIEDLLDRYFNPAYLDVGNVKRIIDEKREVGNNV